jgi:hypothetical protein
MDAKNFRSRALVTVAAAVMVATLSISAAVAAGARQAAAPLPSLPVRLQQMRHHYLEVTRVQEALIRGDLAAVGAPARALGEMPTPDGAPLASLRYLVGLTVAGRQAPAHQASLSRPRLSDRCWFNVAGAIVPWASCHSPRRRQSRT